MARHVRTSPTTYSVLIKSPNISQLNLAAHYTRLIARWPIDALRPENRQFQRLLENRLRATNDTAAVDGNDLSKQANAAYLLLDDVLSKRYPLSDKLMKPASRPTLYEELDQELQEGPRRGMMSYIWKRITGMVRRQ